MIPPVYESVRTLEASERPATDACYEWMRGREWKACKGRYEREKKREDFKERISGALEGWRGGEGQIGMR